MERRAAYEAISSAGFVPLVFDSPLNHLRDHDIPQSGVRSERRRSRDRVLRDQVDVLLSQADLFIGIYHETLGPCGWRVTGEQSWLEYELYRFITKFVVQEEASLGLEIFPRDQFPDTTKRDLKNAKDDEARTSAFMRAGHHSIQPQLIRAALAATGPEQLVRTVQDIARRRVRLYHREDREPEPALREFLSPFEPFSTRGFKSSSSPYPQADNIERFIPAHGGLFAHIHDRFIAAVKSEELRKTFWRGYGPGDSIVHFGIRSDHRRYQRPGMLYLILRSCFQAALRLELVVVTTKSGDQDENRVDLWASPFRSDDTPMEACDRAREQLCDVFSRLRDGCLQAGLDQGSSLPDQVSCRASNERNCPIEVDLRELPDDNLYSKKVRTQQRRAGHWKWAYRMRFLDVPSTLWSIVSLLASYGGNVAYLTFDSFFDRRANADKVGFEADNQVMEVELGIGSDPESAPGFSGDVHAFEYQLKCLYGYISSRRVP